MEICYKQHQNLFTSDFNFKIQKSKKQDEQLMLLINQLVEQSMIWSGVTTHYY